MDDMVQDVVDALTWIHQSAHTYNADKVTIYSSIFGICHIHTVSILAWFSIKIKFSGCLSFKNWILLYVCDIKA